MAESRGLVDVDGQCKWVGVRRDGPGCQARRVWQPQTVCCS